MTSSIYSSSPLPPHPTAAISPLKRNAMSLTQTYQLAHLARGKLGREAARAEHRLHRLVGHANLLDSLMLDLHAAEQEQEQWFNNTVKAAAAAAAATPSIASEPRRVQWADRVMAAEVEAAVADLSDSEEESEEDEDEFDDDSDYEMDDDFLELVRVPSHRATSHVATASKPDATESYMSEIEITSSPSASSSSSSEDDEDEAALHDLSVSLAPQSSQSSSPSTSLSTPASPTLPDLESDDSASEDEYDEDEDLPVSPLASEDLTLEAYLADITSARRRSLSHDPSKDLLPDLVNSAYFTAMAASTIAAAGSSTTSSTTPSKNPLVSSPVLPSAGNDGDGLLREVDISDHHHQCHSHHPYHHDGPDALVALDHHLALAGALPGVAVY